MGQDIPSRLGRHSWLFAFVLVHVEASLGLFVILEAEGFKFTLVQSWRGELALVSLPRLALKDW